MENARKSNFKNALVSVSDKTGLVEFLRPLVADGLRVVSTGGTAEHLRKAGIAVVEVATQTGFPECLDGRVRTLHPHVHVPLLARPEHKEDQKILHELNLQPFDLVIVNLYPFAQAKARNASFEELIENIDIGGPTLLRAASKNFANVTVVCDPSDYQWILEKKSLEKEDRLRLAAKVFAHTTQYDALIAETLTDISQKNFHDRHYLAGTSVTELRYGENPQQKAFWLKQPGAKGLHDAEILQGKALSYNNLLDLEAALSCVRQLGEPSVVAVKHNNPCGVGSSPSIAESTKLAVEADPTSVFGGILAFNREVDQASAEKISKIFLECVLAPSYSPEARQILAKKKDLRVLAWAEMLKAPASFEFRSVTGGYLLQQCDSFDSEAWKPLDTPEFDRTITGQIRHDLEFAWKVAASLKSNSIAIAQGGQTLGLGMGQVNRVEAVEHAIARFQRYHPNRHEVVLASDAFFPFADSLELIAKAGIRWIVQPGGSIRDEDVFKRARELGLQMVLTSVRHFRH